MFISEDTMVVRIPVFQGSFCLVDTEEKLDFMLENNPGSEKFLCKWGEVNGWVSRLKGEDGLNYYVMGLCSTDPSVIVHESVHMAHFIMKVKGIPINRKNTEVEAYLVQFLADTLFDYYGIGKLPPNKKSKKKKKKGKK